MQKERTQQIIDRMLNMVTNGQSAPLSSSKVIVPREEMTRLLRELSDTMETELKNYREITDKRAKILNAAKKEAEDIIYEAEQTASRMRISKRSTNVAPLRMEELPKKDQKALEQANEIYAASVIYTDEMLTEVDELVKNAYSSIKDQYEAVLRDLKNKSKIIAQNKQELMNDLHDLEKEDRYQQIVEISQLLSNELYIERKKAKSEEHIDSIQLEFKFEQETETKEKEEKEEKKEEPVLKKQEEPEKEEQKISIEKEEKKPDDKSVMKIKFDVEDNANG